MPASRLTNSWSLAIEFDMLRCPTFLMKSPYGNRSCGSGMES